MMLAFEFLIGVAAATLTITHGFQQNSFHHSIVENSCITQPPQSYKRNKSIVSWKRVPGSSKSIRIPTQQYYILGGETAKLSSRCTSLSTSVCYMASIQQKESKSNHSLTNVGGLVEGVEGDQTSLNEGTKKIISQEFWCVVNIVFAFAESYIIHT
jgi:hypothetical protein